MKKNFFRTLLLTCLVALGSVPAFADYDNVEGVVSWANGNETFGTVSSEISDAVLMAGFSVGTDLSVTGPTTYTLGTTKTTLMTYQPSTSNAGCVADDMIEYKVKVKQGLTFVPTSVEFDVVKEGTDNAYISWSYTVDGVEGAIVKYSDPKNQIRRNNNANPDAPLTHVENITADGGRDFTFRVYISNVANDKKMSVGNIKIHGKVNGAEVVRTFKDFKVNFRTNPYTVISPAEGLPEGVVVNGTFHDNQHGYNTTNITVPVDGPVKFTFGSCNYGTPTATIKNAAGEVLATLDCNDGCDSDTSYDHGVTWVYNSEESTTLTITTASYIPFFYAEATDLLPMVNVSYYNTNGALLGEETIQGGSKLVYKYGVEDLIVPAGQAFRGWFTSTLATSLKMPEGTVVQENIKLYARATEIEVPTSTKRFIYDLTKKYFYLEDHEALQIEGNYYNEHGWLVGSGKSVKVNVAGKCYITVGNCKYSAESTASVKDPAGNEFATFPVQASADGAQTTFTYDGEPGWITITFPSGAYVHNVSVWNVVDFVDYNEETGYYSVSPGDVSSLLIAIKAASSNPGSKIFLPNGVYDLGLTTLTNVSGKNVSIIGESMDGTIIRNAPLLENEGIGETATILNASENLYMQDLTLHNNMSFTGGTGRAVCLQDKGKNTICKNVKLLSYQDTYYSNAANKFYWEDCEIHGVVDYVCGDGDVVYNRTKFVNEAIKAATLAAPYTSASCKWGYVMLDCDIETFSPNFNLGRSWGGESKLQYIRCKDLSNKLVASRWTVAGMNVAAYKFKEYGMMDKDGKITTPESKVVTFTHSSGNKTYETVLSAEEAAEYTVANIFGTWNPDQICAQEVITEEEMAAPNADAIYLVDGQVMRGTIPAGAKVVRKANSRGGFGPAFGQTDAVSNLVVAPVKNGVAYNILGQRVNAETAKGVVIVDGKKYVAK